ncbi:MerR family transcriptional regulator [Nocardia cyriacigeorgica]|uniref:MerR family transcriptional regulator n=1 Tax=Nocardia cyriacigeorgica TaxID=135487 RepID=UPI001893D3BD|nr:MerR family transcriptional regulator [Nocardia cyriacigeorgica]MBF6416157.1 MerR family transcriptional regulator [Nocardia cyriacigeorgica]
MSETPVRTHLQIGQVAERTELSIKTIRHYDEVGLVTPSARSAGGFRLYTDDDIDRLLVIRRMKPLGFTLAEMKELLEALDALADPESTSEQQAEATETLHALRAKAEDSCENLRRQLAYAEEFTELLTTRIDSGR